jgi:CRP-like cAMP-binding protein
MVKNFARPFTSFRPPARGGDGNSIRNEILLGLSRKDCAVAFSKLKLVDLKLNDLLQKAGEKIEFVYFPNTAMVSVLNLMEDGRSIEVGLVGKEGAVGLPLLGGFRTSSHRVVTQGNGTAYRIGAQEFRKLLSACPHLGTALVRYSQTFIMQTTQIAACNRLHEVEERLARWLLMTHDRVANDELPLTQEFLGQMLGARRASVSVSASILQKAGLISYIHGKVKILNRRGLEKASCECYGVMQQHLATWNLEQGNKLASQRSVQYRIATMLR